MRWTPILLTIAALGCGADDTMPEPVYAPWWCDCDAPGIERAFNPDYPGGPVCAYDAVEAEEKSCNVPSECSCDCRQQDPDGLGGMGSTLGEICAYEEMGP